MLKRNILDKLIEWKDNPDKKALLIKGARGVGKTTIIRKFGKTHYDSFIELNFELFPSYKEIFDGNLDASTITRYLSLMNLGKLIEHKTLIFFDEIEFCPNARTAIKFLVEDGRFDYIESISLLGVNYKEVSSYPVGFEDQLTMYPLSFEEFLINYGVSQELINSVKDRYNKLEKVDDFAHKQLIGIFRFFLIVGGMPEAVAKSFNNDDTNETILIQKKIIAQYKDDISKYSGQNKILIRNLLEAIHSNLGKENKRFMISSIDPGATVSKYEEPILWMNEAGISYQCFNLSGLELPLILYEKRNQFKIYLSDSGLLCSQFQNPSPQYDLFRGRLDINEGSIVENAIANELIKKGVALRYYERKSRCENNFILEENYGITICEVKSGKYTKKHSSLDMAIADLKKRKKKITRSIVFSKENVEYENGITYLPFYMIMFFEYRN
jgi:predicted AAA+ superfamily ATPase